MTRLTIPPLAALLLCLGCRKYEVPAASEPAPEASQAAGARPEPAETPPADGEPAAPPDARAPARPEPPDRLERPLAPDAPLDNLLLVVHNAATGCAANAPLCPARDALAAKLALHVEETRVLLDAGTDQQKQAVREALLRGRDSRCDGLLATVLIGADGALDRRVVDHAGALRVRAAAVPLSKHLAAKAVGDEAVFAIDTLSRIGGPEALDALKTALSNARLAPYSGEVCRALSRLVAVDQRESAARIAGALNATDRQLLGCSSADAALRTLHSAGGLTLHIGGSRQEPGAVLLRQRAGDPLGFEMAVVTEGGAACEAASKPRLALRVPLDRDGEPLVGEGLVFSLEHEGRDLGSSGAFLLRFDALEMRRGASAKGTVFASHTREGDPQIVLSGHFAGTWCGVAD